MLDINNPIIQLCMEGTRAEFEHRIDEARVLYQKAWDARTDDYDACVAAHYLARFQDSAEESLRWNQLALNYANAVNGSMTVRTSVMMFAGNPLSRACSRIVASPSAR